VLFIYFQSSAELYAQCESSPSECQPLAEGHGPDPCDAKLYCSNSGAVEQGYIACTTAADTDGCGVQANAPVAGFTDATLFTSQDVHEDCYSDPDTGENYNYVQWIKFATPPTSGKFTQKYAAPMAPHIATKNNKKSV